MFGALGWDTILLIIGVLLLIQPSALALYASSFFVITGFHGFHVFVGLILLSMTWVLSVLGKFDGPNINFFDCVALYWHFVDIVWIVVFTILYIPQFVPFLTT